MADGENILLGLIGALIGMGLGVIILLYFPRVKAFFFNIFEWIASKLIPGYDREYW